MHISSYGQDANQFGELRTPEGHKDRPLVVLIHGGFWRDQYHLDLMHPLCNDLCERGFATWNIEYRRVGPTGGGWYTTLLDVAAAIDHVKQRWKSIAVVGHSAGGHLALWNASRVDAPQPPSLTIGLAPVADVVAANRNGTGNDATANFFGGNVDEVPERYAHAQPMPDRYTGRVVLVHGDADINVPVEQSRAQAGQVARIEILEAVDHFAVIDPAHVSWMITVTELEELA